MVPTLPVMAALEAAIQRPRTQRVVLSTLDGRSSPAMTGVGIIRWVQNLGSLTRCLLDRPLLARDPRFEDLDVLRLLLDEFAGGSGDVS
jgi:hypothetical protein